jgi:Fic family protein
VRIPLTPPDYLDVLSGLSTERLQEVWAVRAGPAPGGRYRHWDTLRHLEPPGNLSSEEWWARIRFARESLLRELPLSDGGGAPFWIGMPDPASELVHLVDRDASGMIEVSEQVTNPETRARYVVSSIVEEAIRSSQLEGAATTRPVAKDMLRTGRAPRNRGERMILNNYHVMERIHELKSEELTPDLVLELHRITTEHTLDTPDAAGRFRRGDEDVRVFDIRDGELLHTPPDARELPGRLRALCRFANGKTPSFFLHPVARAIVLHFWLAYDHPFLDGNGRTARAIFYWSMLRQGYWLCEYISISSILRKAPARYARAFLYSETDGNDLTYFLLHQLAVLRRAIETLHRHLERKMEELRRTESLLRRSAEFNHRQIALLGHALRHPGHLYTAKSHQFSHGVTNQTARTDLMKLAEAGLLKQRKAGRKFVFQVPEDLAGRLGTRRKSRRPRRK